MEILEVKQVNNALAEIVALFRVSFRFNNRPEVILIELKFNDVGAIQALD